MSNYTVKVTDDVLDAAEEVRLSAKQVRDLFPKSGKGTEDPLYKLYKHIPDGSSAKSVSDILVSQKFYDNLNYMVGKYALKKLTYLKKGTKAYNSAVGLHMLNMAPVNVEAPSIKDNTMYLIPMDERLAIMKGKK